MSTSNDKVARLMAERRRVTPEAVEVSMLAKAGDPSTATTASSKSEPERAGLKWVPLSEVLSGQGRRLADLHHAGQTNLVKRMRHGMGQTATSRRGIARQAVLPPVTAFGSPVPQASSQGVAR